MAICTAMLLAVVLATILKSGQVIEWLDSQSWGEKTCHVVSSTLEVVYTQDAPSYAIDIRYTYTIDGRAYEGTRYDFTSHTTSSSTAESIVAAYVPETQVACFVDQDTPSRSVLVRNVPISAFEFLSLGGIVLFVNVTLL